MKTQEFLDKIPEEIRLNSLGICRPLPELVLDVRVLKALGKGLGWEENKCPECGYTPEGRGWLISNPVKCPECFSVSGDIWKIKMHQMIDHIIAGGSAESFIEGL
jgi:hypothetical protein